MKKPITKKREKLFPIYFNGKTYYKKDCDDIFLGFYHCREALNHSCGVYMTEGMLIYPDGSMKDL